MKNNTTRTAGARRTLDRLFTRSGSQRRTRLTLILISVIAVPVAVAGFFAGSLSNADSNLENIPALVVNNDTLIYSTLPDGTEQPIFAGRQLVTELTAETSGFSWTVSNTEDAQKALTAGSAYAVLTIPDDFSTSVNTISGSDPEQANLNIQTDDAHGYLAGAVAQSVGDAMTTTFGRAITTQYLASLYEGMADMGDSLGTAADGAHDLSTGAGSLASGLTDLSTGASAASDGASALAAGIDSYTGGVDSLSNGLWQLDQGAAGLNQLGNGVAGYTSGVSQAAAGFQQLKDGLLQSPANEQFRGALNEVGGGLWELDSQGTQLSQKVWGAIGGIQDGIADSAYGANQLSDGSAGLRSGASELASGSIALADGAESSASGATKLTSGATELADGLSSGAEQATSIEATSPEASAKVVAEPVTMDVDTANEISSIGQVIGIIFIPIGAWIGAMVIFLVMRPYTRVALASTVSTARFVNRRMLRAAAIAAAQALALVLLLHTALGVGWSLVGQTLPFALLAALVFTGFHYLLTAAFGRAGIVISVVLLGLQLTSTAGLYPVQLLAEPFQVISGLLPLTHAVQGMQWIVSGAGGGQVAIAALALAGLGAASYLLSLWVVGRKRGARSISYAPAHA